VNIRIGLSLLSKCVRCKAPRDASGPALVTLERVAIVRHPERCRCGETRVKVMLVVGEEE
jgi:hypothetical protein